MLLDLFERGFIERQEAARICVIGQCHDLDDPERFVSLRGYPDMAARGAALAAFYGGPVWQAQREAANATMPGYEEYARHVSFRIVPGLW